MQTRIALMVCVMFMLTGCSGVAIFRQIDLIYTPNNKYISNKVNNMATIYLQKPTIDKSVITNNTLIDSDVISMNLGRTKVINKFIKTEDALNYFKSNGIEARFMKDSPIIWEMDKGFANLDSTYFNVGTAFQAQSFAKDPSDWIVGALGTELKASGYSVQYVTTIPEDSTYGVVMNIRNLFSMIIKEIPITGTPIWHCRGNIDIDISILYQGKTINKFNINNEKDFPGYSLDSTNHTHLNCNSAALTGTLSQIMQQAVPTIVKSLEGR